MRKSLMKKLLILLILSIFLIQIWAMPVWSQTSTPKPYTDNEVTSETIMLDLLVIKPLSLLSTTVGGVIFIGTLPFSIWSGKDQVKLIGEKLVIEPANYTFKRPIGRIEKYPENN